jgi:ribosomal protein S8
MDTFEGQDSDIYFCQIKNYKKEEKDFVPTKKMEYGNRQDYELNKNGFLDQYKSFVDPNPPILFATKTIKEPLRERKGCKRIHPIKNISYDIQTCIEHPLLLSKNQVQTAVKTGKKIDIFH